MKKLLFLLLLLPALGVAKAPIEEDIIDRTMDAASPYYYPALMMRYNVGDKTLTDNDFHYLYYGYAYQESYKPLETDPAMDRLLMLLARIDPDKPEVEAIDALIILGDEVLARDPFNPKVLNIMTFAYGAKGDAIQETAYARRKDGVLRTILASGDGLTQKSPRHILMFDHATDVMSAEGLPTHKARIVSRTVEFLPLVQPYMVDGKKRKGFFFDFGRVYWNKPEGYTYKRDRTWQFNNLKPREYK